MIYDIVKVYYKDSVRWRVTGMNEEKAIVEEKIFNTKEDAEAYLKIKNEPI
tara:strand:+ start:298 stop:450 length:153 start_codon:yes stop_codon:yes gene_type:complete